MKKQPPSQSLSAQGRFESLAKRLFAVPKRELDEKLAEYESKKKSEAAGGRPVR